MRRADGRALPRGQKGQGGSAGQQGAAAEAESLFIVGVGCCRLLHEKCARKTRKSPQASLCAWTNRAGAASRAASQAAKTGVYCGPLRLLAMEVYDACNADGTYCNLITGGQLVMMSAM